MSKVKRGGENRVKKLRIAEDLLLDVFDYMCNKQNSLIDWPENLKLPPDARVLRFCDDFEYHGCFVLLIASDEFPEVDVGDMPPMISKTVVDLRRVSMNQREDLGIIESLVLNRLEHGGDLRELEQSSNCMLRAFHRLRQAWKDGEMIVVSMSIADYFRSEQACVQTES